jgi:hypothetical protein
MQKRVRFIEEAANLVNLSNVVPLCGRAEAIGQQQEHRESYSLVVARAVAELPVLAELCLPLAAVGSVWMAAKGPSIEVCWIKRLMRSTNLAPTPEPVGRCTAQGSRACMAAHACGVPSARAQAAECTCLLCLCVVLLCEVSIRPLRVMRGASGRCVMHGGRDAWSTVLCACMAWLRHGRACGFPQSPLACTNLCCTASWDSLRFRTP